MSQAHIYLDRDDWRDQLDRQRPVLERCNEPVRGGGRGKSEPAPSASASRVDSLEVEDTPDSKLVQMLDYIGAWWR